MQDPKEKILKLLRLAESANENEAALAAERAAELAIKHGIDISTLNTDTDYLDDKVESRKREQWVAFLAGAIAQLNACKCYLSDGDYHFVGRPSSVAACKATLQYLIQTIKRLNREAVSSYNWSREERQQYRKSFRLHASLRVTERLRQKLADMKAHGIKTEGSTTNALTVQSYFKQEQENITAFLDGKVKLGKSRAVRITTKSAHGAIDGAKAGSSISLDEQITSKNQLQIAQG